MTVLAIDPGPEQSAWVLWDGQRVKAHAKCANSRLLTELREPPVIGTELVIEQIASYGMPVGAEVFDTCVWAGRFIGAWTEHRARSPWALMPRRNVKLHLCGQARANDSNIRQALIDRFGGKGTKANPGPFYGLKADEWQALALGVTFYDQAVAKAREAQASGSVSTVSDGEPKEAHPPGRPEGEA